MSQQVEVKVPDIGDFSEVAVIELLVKPGDTVKVEQSLITVESDKASMEIPSSHAGVVKEIKVALGDKVSEGSVVLVLEASGAGASEPTGSGAGPAAPGGAAPGASASGTAPPVTAAKVGRGCLRRWRRVLVAARTSNAMCWCSVAGLAGIRRRFARRIWV